MVAAAMLPAEMHARIVFAATEIAWPAFGAVRRAASGLERAGVGDGDVVCILLRNEPAYLEAIFAARWLGAYACPINWHYKADEAGWILRDSGARALVAAPELLAQVEGGVPQGVAFII